MSTELDPATRQLPSGRHGLDREAVIAQQRQRMLDAVATVLSRKGFVAMTVEDVAVEAGVSRRTFYENFAEKTDCFLAAYHAAVEQLVAVVVAATGDAVGWEEKVNRALTSTLRFFARNVELAHLAVIEVLAAGPRALAARDEALRRLVSCVATDEPLGIAVDAPPLLLLQMLAGSVTQAVYAEVLHGRAERLEQLQPLLAYLIIVPMFGPAEAARRTALGAPHDD